MRIWCCTFPIKHHDRHHAGICIKARVRLRQGDSPRPTPASAQAVMELLKMHTECHWNSKRCDSCEQWSAIEVTLTWSTRNRLQNVFSIGQPEYVFGLDNRLAFSSVTHGESLVLRRARPDNRESVYRLRIGLVRCLLFFITKTVEPICRIQIRVSFGILFGDTS
jgi:hypothetical protein